MWIIFVVFLVAFAVAGYVYKDKIISIIKNKGCTNCDPVVKKVEEVCLTGDCANPKITTCAGGCCDANGKPCNVGATAVKINLSPINDPKDGIRPGVLCAKSKGAKVDVEIVDPDGEPVTVIQWFDIGPDKVSHLLPFTGNKIYYRFAFNHTAKVVVTVDKLAPVGATMKSL